MARQTTTALREGIESHVAGVDFINETDDTVEFTVMWGGVSDDERSETLEGMERFSEQYDVGIVVSSAGPEASTYRVVPDHEPFEADVMADIHFA